MKLGRILRIGAAVAILISGIVHLDLYFNQDYRFASPNANFGRSLLLNAIASGLVATALVVRKDWFIKAGGIIFSASTIAVFAYTHSSHTFLGYSHGGPAFEPSPQAQIALIVQIASIVLLAASLVPAVDTEDEPLRLPVLGGAFAVCAIVLIGLTLRWRPDDTKSVATAAASGTAPAPGGPTTTVAAAPGATPTTAGAATATTAAGAAPTTVAGATTTTAAAGGSAPAGAQVVTIVNFAFAPMDLRVKAGTTVTWTNNDSAAHTVAATDKSFTSGNLAKGATFQFMFAKAGTYKYICGIHNYMTATITVTG